MAVSGSMPAVNALCASSPAVSTAPSIMLCRMAAKACSCMHTPSASYCTVCVHICVIPVTPGSREILRPGAPGARKRYSYRLDLVGFGGDGDLVVLDRQVT